MELQLPKCVSAPCTPTEQTRLGHSSSVKKKNRSRVHFPADEFLVTCYLDPPDPWSKGLSREVDSLLSAYVAACEVQGIQPLPGLVEQLQEIQNSENQNYDQRVHDLVLVGEKLSTKQCEALEEVLRRIKFNTIDLEGCSLEDEGATALFDMIEYYDSAIQLNISYIKHIDCRGWQACSRMLKKTSALVHLNARSTLLNEQVLLILGKALRLGSNLTTLHLENCGIYGRCLVILVAALKSNTTLRELFLAENKISSSDGFQLGNLLRTNTHLELLDLSNNKLQNDGLTHLMESLGQQSNTSGRGLSTLILWNNELSVQGMPCIAKALNSARTLKRFNLGSNDVTSTGVQELKQSFICNQTLEVVELENCKITASGAVALAGYISSSNIIQKLDLRGNDIALSGVKALCSAMAKNHSVISLQVDPTSMDLEENVKDRMNEIQLINQYCSRNKEEYRFKPAQDVYLSTLFNGIFSRVIPTTTAMIAAQECKQQDSSNSQLSRIMAANKNLIQKGRFQVSPVSLPEEKKFRNDLLNTSKRNNAINKVSGVDPSSLDEDEVSPLSAARVDAPPFDPDSLDYYDEEGEEEEDSNDVFISDPIVGDQKELSAQFKRRHSDVSMYYSKQCQDVLGPNPSKSGCTPVQADVACQRHHPIKDVHLVARKDLILNLVSQNSAELSDNEYKERRLSSPTMSSTEPHIFRKVHSIKCCKALEGLDLCSSMPLSPTRLYENFSFPQPSMEEVVSVSSDAAPQSLYMVH